MKKLNVYTIIGIALIGSSLLLTGCGKKNTLSDTIENSTKKMSEKEAEESEESEEAEESEEIEDKESIDSDTEAKEAGITIDEILGTYVYALGDEDEERIFEISKIGGNYYIEYMGNYDYAGGEMEFIDASDDGNGGIDIKVEIYPFSGFSFAGEYWGTGSECTINRKSNGDIVLGEGQPFVVNGAIDLKQKSGLAVHEITLSSEKNTTCDEIIGTWRCESERDGDVHEIILEFAEDGTFKAVNKVQDYPAVNYIGKYYATSEDGTIHGYIQCERFAYGSMPYEWVIEYDKDQGCPVIYEDYTYAEPFTFKEDEKNLSFKMIKDGEAGNTSPGPGRRTSEVEYMYKEYMGE